MKISEIQERVSKLTPIPTKIFPLVLVGEGEQYRVMNEYLQFALDAQTYIKILLEEIDSLRIELTNHVF